MLGGPEGYDNSGRKFPNTDAVKGDAIDEITVLKKHNKRLKKMLIVLDVALRISNSKYLNWYYCEKTKQIVSAEDHRVVVNPHLPTVCDGKHVKIGDIMKNELLNQKNAEEVLEDA